VIIESFRSHLVNNSGISAITSSIWPKTLPQSATKPAITWGVDGDDHEQVFGGISSLKEALFDVDCWDLSYIAAHQLADAVEDALVGHTGNFGALSPPDEVDHIRKERRFDLFESDTRLFRVSLQFFVAYY
jgi:hypothetical protein